MRRRVLFATAAVLLSVGVLTLWLQTPPLLEASFRMRMAYLVRWVEGHLLTATVAGLALSAIGLAIPFVLRRIDWAEDAKRRRQDQDRQVMLARVEHRWIAGVLDKALTDPIPLTFRSVPRSESVRSFDSVTNGYGTSGNMPLTSMSMHTVFSQCGGGLLILGKPGSGKTTALLELARALVQGAKTDEAQPIPIIFNLSSWAVRRSPLSAWIIDELRSRYFVPRPIGRRWLATNQVLPLLDGLDEMTRPDRATCVREINGFVREHGLVRFAVCCRSQEYISATEPVEVEEAIELVPPGRHEISEFLAANGTALSDVGEALARDDGLWDVLASPLVLNIVALTYRNRLADALHIRGTPAQRLESLLKAYVERMLEHRMGRHPPEPTRRWLVWLAQSMMAHQQSEFHLDRVQTDWLPGRFSRRIAQSMPAFVVGTVPGIPLAVLHGPADGAASVLFFGLTFGIEKPASQETRRLWPRLKRAIAVGVTVGVMIGFIAVVRYTVAQGLTEGLFFGVLGGLLYWLRRAAAVEEVGWSWWRASIGLAVGLAGGLLCGLVYGLWIGLLPGLFLGVAFGLAIGAAYGLVPRLHGERTSPNEGVHRSAVLAIVVGTFFGILFGIPFARLFGIVEALLYGLLFGLAGAMVFGGLACAQHYAVRLLLVWYGLGPLNYARFLDESTHRLFLHRTGGGYIFIHRLLLEHLANQSIPELGNMGNRALRLRFAFSTN